MTAVERAFHGLRQMIAGGRLVAGQRIPPENELCEELGVSRSSLREAVRMLAALRVIEPRHGSGTYVSPLRTEDFIGSLSLTVDLLPLTGLLELYEIRRVLESHAAAQAAARMSEEELSTVFGYIADMEASTDPAKVSEIDHRFHAAIARAGGNPALESLLQVFRSRSRSYQVFDLPEGPRVKQASDEDHRAIATALARHDPVAAAGAASAHVAHTEAWLRVLMPQPTPPGRPE